MSSSLPLSQIAAQIEARLKPVLPDNEADLLARLESPQTVGLFLDALAVEPTRLRHALEELIASFTRQHSDLVRGHLRCAVPLPALAKGLLSFLVAAGPPCDTTAIWDAIAPIDQRLDDAIAAYLPSQCEGFTLCGYGLGNGAYEQQLAERFAAHGTTIKLFGYDPTNARFDTERIQPCSLETLRSEGSPRFDVILTRWVLHHVPPDQRWDAFAACVHRCQPGGSLLIVEEGPFSAEKNRTSLVYELLSSGADVLVNSVVYPDWLGAGDPPGEHFYLAYLTQADIKALESAFAMRAERHLEWHQAGYLPQILIRYNFCAMAPLAV
jgi:2-polyprenyl-3-methyl-5-hydroxy-6-metoxy-1,4-benzoquinol methylase